MVKAEQAAQAGHGDAASADSLGGLTQGERLCLQLVASGMVSKEIARSLDISPHTVDARLRTATRKLGARNRFVAAQMLIAHQKNQKKIGSLSSQNLAAQNFTSAEKGAGVAERASESADGDPADAMMMPSNFVHPQHKTDCGGVNRLSVGPRLLLITGFVLGALLAFTAVAYGLSSWSRMLSAL